jgi:hypothetical protein
VLCSTPPGDSTDQLIDDALFAGTAARQSAAVLFDVNNSAVQF